MLSIHYRDLVNDTMGTIEKIYDFHHIPFTDAGRHGIATYLRENPRESRPAHKVQKGSEDMIARDRKIFKRYMDYFGVAEE